MNQEFWATKKKARRMFSKSTIAMLIFCFIIATLVPAFAKSNAGFTQSTESAIVSITGSTLSMEPTDNSEINSSDQKLSVSSL